jgi:hypothetical protein
MLLFDNIFYPIEIKFQESVSERDFFPMKKLGFDKGIILTKHQFLRKDDFVGVPLSVFLSVLELHR